MTQDFKLEETTLPRALLAKFKALQGAGTLGTRKVAVLHETEIKKLEGLGGAYVAISGSTGFLVLHYPNFEPPPKSQPVN